MHTRPNTERHEYLRQRVHTGQATAEEYVEFAHQEYDMRRAEAERVFYAEDEIQLPDGSFSRS